MYEKELRALQKAGRLRKRRLFDSNLKDFASNDYLGLAHNKELLDRAYQRVRDYPANAAKASQLINGYTPIHQVFEEYLCHINGFEAAVTFGSGFLANMGIFEALTRKKDKLFLDEEFHASGVLASKLAWNVEFFSHNDPDDLRRRLCNGGYDRAIVGVEGIYSMSGDLLDPAIFDVAKEAGALLVVDEAHSVGVVGEKLLGVFDLFGIEPTKNHIKMGTMGKALGSYGAYVLASEEIVSFLENRAKSLIYTTALSLMDVALAHEGMRYVQNNLPKLHEGIAKRRDLAKSFGYSTPSLILDVPKKDVIKEQMRLLDAGYIVGAIRPPTVPEPMLRIIPRLAHSSEDFRSLLELV